jgi:hypothetical protein
MSNRASQEAPPSLVQVLKTLARDWRDREERARQFEREWQRTRERDDWERKPDEEKEAEYAQLDALQTQADEHRVHDLIRLIEEHTGLPREVGREMAWRINSNLGLAPLKRPGPPGRKPDLPDLRPNLAKLGDSDANGTTEKILSAFGALHRGALAPSTTSPGAPATITTPSPPADHLTLAPATPPPEDRTGRGGKNGKNINAQILAKIHADPESVAWSAQQWAEHLGCTKSTVAETKAWKETLKVAKQIRIAEAAVRMDRTHTRASRNLHRAGNLD